MSIGSIKIITMVLLFAVFLAMIFNFNSVKQKITNTIKNLNLIFFSFVLLFLGFLSFDSFSSTDLVKINIGYSKYFQIIMMTVALITSCLYAYKENISISNLFKMPIILLLIYSYIAMFSSLLLHDAFFLPIYKALLLVLDFFILSVIMALNEKFYNFNKMFNLIKLEFALITLILLIGIIVWPDMALRKTSGLLTVQLFGVIPTLHPNTAGYISVIAAIFFWGAFLRATAPKDKLLFILLLSCALFALILAQSRTSLINILCCFLVFELLRKNYKGIIVMIFFVFIIYLYHYNTLQAYWMRGSTTEVIGTLSGRTIGWNYSVSKFFESPFFGYGFAGGVRFGSVFMDSRHIQQILTNMHNSYAEILISLGLFGFLPWMVSIFYILFRVTTNYSRCFLMGLHHSKHIEIVTILLCSLIRSITGVTFVYHDFSIYILLIIIFYSKLNFIKTQNGTIGSFPNSLRLAKR